MGRVYLPKSEKPKRGAVVEPELITGRYYVVTEPAVVEDVNDEVDDVDDDTDEPATVVEVTEPAQPTPAKKAEPVKEPAPKK